MKEIQEGMTADQVSATIMGNFSEVSEQVAEAKRLTAAEEERARGAEQNLLSAVAQNVGDIKSLREVAATKEALSALDEQAGSNQQGVAKNAEDIEAEKQRAIAAEGEIRGSVESLGEDLNAASEDISKLEVALEAEKSRAKAAEQALSTEITEAENRVDERVTEVRNDLEAEVQARSEAVADLNSNTGISEYPVFSESTNYAVGDVVVYEGRLKRFIADHAAGEWNGTDVESWSERKEIGYNEVIKRSFSKEFIQAFVWNFFDETDNDYYIGGYLNGKGEIIASENAAISGYIPFPQEVKELTLSVNGYINNDYGGYTVLYDIDKNVVNSKNASGTAIWEDGVAFVRFSIPKYKNGNIQIERGSEFTRYMIPGVLYSKKLLINGESIEDNSIDNRHIGKGAIQNNNIECKSIEPNDTTFFKVNLCNPDSLTQGYYLDNKGGLRTSGSYAISDFITFTKGKLILSVNGVVNHLNGGFIVYYDNNKEYIDSEEAGPVGQIATWHENVAFVRFSIAGYKTGNIQIEVGDVVSEYVEYTENPKLLKKFLPDVDIEIEIKDKSVTAEKLAPNFGAKNSLNLLDLEKCQLNTYVEIVSGEIKYFSSNTLMVSGLIPVKEDTNYTLSYGHSYILLDENMNLAIDTKITASGSKTITIPSGCHFIIVNFVMYKDNIVPYDFRHTNRIYEGNILYPYTPYGVKMGKSFHTKNGTQVISLLGSDGIKLTVENLGVGEELTLGKEIYPTSIKENQISFFAEVTDFGEGIQIGRGFTAYNSGYFKITQTSIVLYRYEGTERLQETVEHGLSISEYIKIVVSERGDKALFILQTLEGIFEHEFVYKSAYNGAPAVKSLGASFTNCEISATSKQFKRPVWMFGDSYYGADGDYRQMYWLKKWDMLNCLVQAFAGQGSQNAYFDLEKCLNYGCPKYIVWSLGMNDDNSLELDDITTGNWYKYFEQVKQLCELNDITLICTTIPEVRGENYKNKDKMSEVIRNSGLRYIDVAKAVGSNSEGKWYGDGTEYDYQATDNVHPSKYGASAIATQFLIDFPEIMQY